MKSSNNGLLAGIIVCGIAATTAPPLRGQSSPALAEASGWRRLSVGFRVRGFPLDILGDHTLERSTEKPVVSWSYSTTSSSSRVGLGPSLEFALHPKITLNAELLYHRLGYEQVLNVYEGTDDSTTTADERKLTTYTEQTRASYWDVPVLLRYHGVRQSGWLSRMYLSGGAVLRHTTHVRTSHDVVYSSGSTGYDEIPAALSKRNLPGVVAGAGFRFIDDFNIKVTPEVRYTRWLGSTFTTDSTRSPRNQLEIGVAITY